MAGKAKISYSTTCQEHGVEGPTKGVKEIRVSRPKSRGQGKTAGCPICRKQRMAAQQ